MKTGVKIATTLFLALSLSACNSMGSNETVGTIGGGAIGGLIGSQIGSGSGNTVATVVGTLGGAMIGNQIGRDMDRKRRYR